MYSGLVRCGFVLVAAVSLSACVTTPQPLTSEEVDAAARARVQLSLQESEPVRGPIDIHEAIARSIKHNLDYRIEAAEGALRVSEYEVANTAMLPQIAASGGYTARSNYSASSSLNLKTGTDNFSFSTSQDKQLQNADIEIAWNVLDFGLSYIRARQAGDKILIAQELKRKVLQRLVADVRVVFWKALSLQRLVNRMAKISARLQEALSNAEVASVSGDVSRLAALLRRRELVEMQRRAMEFKRDLATAKINLAALMNLPSGGNFTLSDAGADDDVLTMPQIDEAVAFALRNRPEVRENLYQSRMNDAETYAAILELLPGPKFTGTRNFDSNSFVLNNTWSGAGISVAANLINVFTYPRKSHLIELQGNLLELRGQALAMAIATQVHASYARYGEAAEHFKVSSDYRRVQQDVLKQMKVEAEAKKVSLQSLVREELNAVIAEAQYDLSRAALAEARAGVVNSMGLDPYSDIDPAVSMEEMAQGSRAVAQRWEKHTRLVRSR